LCNLYWLMSRSLPSEKSFLRKYRSVWHEC
jgi:hypothetical protein